MPRDTRGHTAIYGGVKMKRLWCRKCSCFSLIIGGKLQCCDSPAEGESEYWRVECAPVGERKKPSAKYQKEQKERQQYRCFYCSHRLGSYARWRGKTITLRTHWDHFVPFAYLQSNPDYNFVAACHVCNSIKGSKCFNDTEEARVYIQGIREQYEHDEAV